MNTKIKCLGLCIVGKKQLLLNPKHQEIKKYKFQKPIDTHDSLVVSRGKGWREDRW